MNLLMHLSHFCVLAVMFDMCYGLLQNVNPFRESSGPHTTYSTLSNQTSGVSSSSPRTSTPIETTLPLTSTRN